MLMPIGFCVEQVIDVRRACAATGVQTIAAKLGMSSDFRAVRRSVMNLASGCFGPARRPAVRPAVERGVRRQPPSEASNCWAFTAERQTGWLLSVVTNFPLSILAGK
jgi:hypothetical protein